MTQDSLASFRSAFVGCELVMLIDISAQTVLTSDSAIPLGQEHLDRLRDQAGRIFAGAAGEAPEGAVLAGPTGCRVFVRQDRAADECLCAVFAPGADLTGVEADMRAILGSDPVEAGA